MHLKHNSLISLLLLFDIYINKLTNVSISFLLVLMYFINRFSSFDNKLYNDNISISQSDKQTWINIKSIYLFTTFTNEQSLFTKSNILFNLFAFLLFIFGIIEKLYKSSLGYVDIVLAIKFNTEI